MHPVYVFFIKFSQNSQRTHPRKMYSPNLQGLSCTTTAISTSCCMHGSISTRFPNPFIPSGKIKRNENESWDEDEHTVNLEKILGTSWSCTITTRRETGGMDTDHSKSILCSSCEERLGLTPSSFWLKPRPIDRHTRFQHPLARGVMVFFFFVKTNSSLVNWVPIWKCI